MSVKFRLCLGELDGPSDDPDATLPVGQQEDREALLLMASAARANPNDPDYHHILGDGLLRAGRVREAEAPCREAVERDPANPDYRFALGCVHWRLGRAARAETAFRETVQRRPDDAPGLNALGAALVRLERYPEAVAALEKALKLDPQSADAHSNMGAALWSAGDRHGAVRSFQRAVRLDPEKADLHRNLAVAQRALGRSQEAVTVLRNMIRRWPDRADLYLDLAEAFHEAGRTAEASRALDEAQRIDATAIAGRSKSREIRDALRIHGVKGEVEQERGSAPGPFVALLHLPIDAIHFVSGLRPPVKAAGFVVLALVVALAWGASRILPHYVTRYLFEDDIMVIARAPVRDDGVVVDRLGHAIRRRGLDGVLDPSACRLETEPSWRRISCRYAVEANVLPGLTQTLRFDVSVEEPYIADPEPIIF